MGSHPGDCTCIVCKNQRRAKWEASGTRWKTGEEEKKADGDLWKILLAIGLVLKVIWLALGGPTGG